MKLKLKDKVNINVFLEGRIISQCESEVVEIFQSIAKDGSEKTEYTVDCSGQLFKFNSGFVGKYLTKIGPPKKKTTKK